MYEYPEKFKDISDFILQNDNFLIVSHISPDGDAVGSVLCFGNILKHLSKNYLMAIDGGTPERYSFLPGADEIKDASKLRSEREFNNLVILDSGNWKRIGSAAKLVTDDPNIINIDHHISNNGFGGISYIEINASSVCEIIYRLVSYMNIPFDREIAFALYTGIMTDTGRFRFSNTTTEALNIAADLISLGADPNVISENVYYNLDRNAIEALSDSLASMKFYADDQLVLMEYHNPDEAIDTEGFIDIAVGIKGVKAVIYIRLIPEDGRYKVSLRGRNGFDVREIAESYGGGGHQSAAGFRYRGSLIELKEKLVGQILSRLDSR